MALISSDIVEVGRVLDLRRLAIDGLRIGACLLVPALQENEAPGETVRTISNQFFDLDTSVETARQLGFPWDVADCLKALKNALAAEEMPIVSGVLSLVWYRHHALSPLRAGLGGEPRTLKTRLRAQAGRLAPSAVVESYIRVLEQSDQAVGVGQDVFVAGEGDPRAVGSSLSELRSHGFRVVEAENFQDARKAFLRRRPAAILVHVDRSREAADGFCSYVREETSRRGYRAVRADAQERAVVPAEPHGHLVQRRAADADGRAGGGRPDLEGADRPGEGRLPAVPARGSAPRSRTCPFIDLDPDAGQRRKERADDGGRPRRTAGGDLRSAKGRSCSRPTGKRAGAAAVYEVIRWQAEGSFRVETGRLVPAETNVTLPTDFILLEGLRRLDEGLAGRRK